MALLDFANTGEKIGLDAMQWRTSIEERPINRSCYRVRRFSGLMTRLAIANREAAIVIEEIAQEEILNVKKVLISVVAENFCRVVRKLNLLCLCVVTNSHVAGLTGQMAAQPLEKAVLFRLAHPNVNQL
ncbi:MAG: hypothetical protein ABJK59_10655 [Erythrobacter sp.]|uniref:hypothetical protein n=1 Tax=Erythrobacter sp. TaxID=1042 RepID=UPI0032979A86